MKFNVVMQNELEKQKRRSLMLKRKIPKMYHRDIWKMKLEKTNAKIELLNKLLKLFVNCVSSEVKE